MIHEGGVEWASDSSGCKSGLIIVGRLVLQLPSNNFLCGGSIDLQLYNLLDFPSHYTLLTEKNE